MKRGSRETHAAMLARTRRRLVWGYSLAILLIMACSVGGSIAVLRRFVADSITKAMAAMLDEEVRESIPMFLAWQTNPSVEPSINTLHVSERAFTITEFWFAPDGTMLMAESDFNSRDALVAAFENWTRPNREIQSVAVTGSDAAQPLFFVATKDDVYRDGVHLGKVFVAANLTPLLQLERYYHIAGFVAVLLVAVLAYFTGNYFASRAIRPIAAAMEMQKHFVADASHELRTPISILLASVDLLDDEGPNSGIVKSMKEEILNMRSLTNSLLTLARFGEDAGGFGVFDLSAAAVAVAAGFQAIADRKNVCVVVSADDGIAFFGDEVRIRQMIGILLDNAIKHSPDNLTVGLEVRARNAGAEIRVSDCGDGIAEEHLPYVFDRFYRVDKARSRQTGGYGLGLSIAKNVVAAHGGEIYAESATGRGSVFTVRLPLKRAASRRA